MKLVSETIPPSANNLATSEILRIFSSRSSGVKPRLLLRPWRMLSPSRLYAGMPWLTRYSSRANEIVVLPAPDRPREEIHNNYSHHMQQVKLNLKTCQDKTYIFWRYFFSPKFRYPGMLIIHALLNRSGRYRNGDLMIEQGFLTYSSLT